MYKIYTKRLGRSSHDSPCYYGLDPGTIVVTGECIPTLPAWRRYDGSTPTPSMWNCSPTNSLTATINLSRRITMPNAVDTPTQKFLPPKRRHVMKKKDNTSTRKKVTYKYCKLSRVSSVNTLGRPKSSSDSSCTTFRPCGLAMNRLRSGHGVTCGRGFPVRREDDIKPSEDVKGPLTRDMNTTHI